MQRLAAALTPDHPELRIPKQYHGECPWPSAQAEIAIINAYKSPRDKMACVVRCCETIENLIILASERGTASADDITPILVFVLLQANPPGLFSNIQYINGFYAARMEGGESYWWTQFTSAVEFIKQMLNKS
ncbi:GTPase activating protein and VPS9 domains 1 [Aphelenchoides avenae]|nr:GTPase activating protein and VPS9 domains 1 [Aphelenchus avenae]